MDKRRFIKDPVWGNIELFSWEAALLKHFLLNRLHNIVQNSCAYLVYPGLKYSRFSHSIGVLHVSTQIFTNLIINSERSLLDLLSLESKQLERAFANGIKQRFISIIANRVGCPEEYALLLGIIRTAALLHDLGHLPYSHVFEFALDRFMLNEFDENQEILSAEVPNESVRNLHSRLRDTFGRSRDGSFKPIHEVLGTQFIQILCAQPVGANKNEDYIPFVNAAHLLWNDNDVPISKSLLSSDIDADRIDFVYRDGLFSGLFHSSIDAGRLFAFYELYTFQDAIKARPNLRAAAEAEKLLWERFLDYSYIAAHHKVHLFDEIMERLLFYCLADGSMNGLLDAVVTIGSKPVTTVRQEIELANAKKAILANLNDSWVDTKLREAYEAEIPLIHPNLEARNILYEGLSERRDLFITLFKRDDDYQKKISLDIKRTISIAAYVKQHKYTWERELSYQTNTVVMIGDLSSKLRTGIKSKVAAEFFGLNALMDFLESKYRLSRPLNAWYYSSNGERDLRIEAEIVEFLSIKLSTFQVS